MFAICEIPRIASTKYLLLSSLLVVLYHNILKSNGKLYIMLGSSLLIGFALLYISRGFYVNDNEKLFQYTISLCVSLTLFFLLLCSIANIIVNVIWKLIANLIMFVIFIFYVFLLLMPLVYYAALDSKYSSDTVLSLLQTNFKEAAEYVFVHPVLMLYAMSVVLIAAIIQINNNFHFRETNILTCGKSFRLLVCVSIFICSYVMIKSFSKSYVTKPWLEAYNYQRELNKYDIQKLQRIKSLAPNIKTNSKGVYVLVIGESLNREHMSVYGYNRNTTPWLKSMILNNSATTLVLKKSYSSYATTLKSLAYALSMKNQYNCKTVDTNIIEIANLANYKTVWISNQVKMGVHDTHTSIIAADAKKQMWLNDSVDYSYIFNKGQGYDYKIVPALDELNKSNAMLLVIHLKGNHAKYNCRYPQDFSKYNNGSIMDEYDNSILYNDYIISEIYKKVSSIPNFQAMVYFSDHGEDVENGLGHTPDHFTLDMVKIPTIIFLVIVI